MNNLITFKKEQIENGIKFVKENTKLLGRIELLKKKPELIIDVSHNPAGLNALIETLELHFPQIKKWNFVFGCMSDKDIVGLLSEIKKKCDELICCSLKIERAAKINAIKEVAINLDISKIKLFDTVKEAVCRSLELNEPTIIAGSFYLIEEAMIYLKKDLHFLIEN